MPSHHARDQGVDRFDAAHVAHKDEKRDEGGEQSVVDMQNRPAIDRKPDRHRCDDRNLKRQDARNGEQRTSKYDGPGDNARSGDAPSSPLGRHGLRRTSGHLREGENHEHEHDEGGKRIRQHEQQEVRER